MVNYDMIINKGSLYCLKVNLEGKDINGLTIPYDLTGMSVRSQIRKTYDTCDFVAFDVTIDDVVNGKITLKLGANISTTLKAGSSFWDLEVYDPTDESIVYRPVGGKVTIVAEVTR